MRENENLKNGINKDIGQILLPIVIKSNQELKISKYLKGLIYLTFLTGITTLFNSCMVGYVSTEPAYIEYERPQQPLSTAIWIEGDWMWNSRTHVYVQERGYWVTPRQGRTYQSGHWKSTPHGKSWSKGYWESERHQKNNHDEQNQHRR